MKGRPLDEGNNYLPESPKDLDPSILKYGNRCKHGHLEENGTTVRFLKLPRTGIPICVGCSYKLPPGPIAHAFGGKLPDGIFKAVKYFEHEKAAARVRQQMEWNARNPEKLRSYQDKYNHRPDIMERHNQYNIAGYHRNIEERRRKNREAYHRKKQLLKDQNDSIC